jgi:SAM-dependent methyltransferase
MMSLNFDVLAEAYDAMIDWDKRLANEAPFYRKLFEQVGARSVLDTACGTGRHAAMFAEWGLRVEAADLNPRMIEHCQARYAGTPNLSFVARSFLLPAERPADVVVCTGNSLALVEASQQADAAIAALCASARSGGAVVVHVLNLLSREEGPVRWDKCKRTNLSTGDALITKGTHRAGHHGYVDFLLADISGPTPKLTVDSVRFLELHREHLEAQCLRHGCDAVKAFGSYRMEPYDALTSGDLILVATKQARQ